MHEHGTLRPESGILTCRARLRAYNATKAVGTPQVPSGNTRGANVMRHVFSLVDSVFINTFYTVVSTLFASGFVFLFSSISTVYFVVLIILRLHIDFQISFIILHLPSRYLLLIEERIIHQSW